MKTLNQAQLSAVSGGYGQATVKTIRVEADRRGNAIIRWIPDGSPKQIAYEALIIGAAFIARNFFDRNEVPPVVIVPPGVA